jgi:hypothetical protein
MKKYLLIFTAAFMLIASLSMNAYLFMEIDDLKIESARHERMNSYQVDINDFLVNDVIGMKMMLGISNPENGWTEEEEKAYDDLSKPVEPQPKADEKAFESLRNSLFSQSGNKIALKTE